MIIRFPTLRELFKYAMIAGLGVIAFAVGIFLYWSASGSDVLEIKNTPVPVRTIREHPTAEGVVILHVDYCKNVTATGRVRTSFYNSSREVFLPVSTDYQQPGCYDVEVPVLIPKDIPPGTYRVKFRVIYQVNPIKQVIEEFDSKPFQVVEQL
jgi:hypothetical protein